MPSASPTPTARSTTPFYSPSSRSISPSRRSEHSRCAGKIPASKFEPDAGRRGAGRSPLRRRLPLEIRPFSVPCASIRPVLSVRHIRASAECVAPPRSQSPRLLSGRRRVRKGHTRSLEFQPVPSNLKPFFDSRPYREAHAAIERCRRQAAIGRAGRVEKLTVGRSGDDEPAGSGLDDVVAQPPAGHAVERQRAAYQALHELQPTYHSLAVGLFWADQCGPCVLVPMDITSSHFSSDAILAEQRTP